MKNADLPAMPQFIALSSCDDFYTSNYQESMGLTKREQLSAMCLQGFLSRNINDMDGAEIVSASISYADELLNQLEEL